MFHNIGRFLNEFFSKSSAPVTAHDIGLLEGVEMSPTWHGDHWQNLLASPMDARHYVVEDWAPAFDESSSGAWAKDGGTTGRRRR